MQSIWGRFPGRHRSDDRPVGANIHHEDIFRVGKRVVEHERDSELVGGCAEPVGCAPRDSPRRPRKLEGSRRTVTMAPPICDCDVLGVDTSSSSTPSTARSNRRDWSRTLWLRGIDPRARVRSAAARGERGLFRRKERGMARRIGHDPGQRGANRCQNRRRVDDIYQVGRWLCGEAARVRRRGHRRPLRTRTTW